MVSYRVLLQYLLMGKGVKLLEFVLTLLTGRGDTLPLQVSLVGVKYRKSIFILHRGVISGVFHLLLPLVSSLRTVFLVIVIREGGLLGGSRILTFSSIFENILHTI